MMNLKWLVVLVSSIALILSCTSHELQDNPFVESSVSDISSSGSQTGSSSASVIGNSWSGPANIQFDVVIRDFQPSHSDFENFDNQATEISAHPLMGYSAFTSQCYGEKIVPPDYSLALGYSPGFSACTDGYPCGAIMPNGQKAIQAFYGEYTLNAGPSAGKTIRDFHNQAVVQNGGTEPRVSWERPAYISKNMVQEMLAKPSEDPYTWYPVRNDAAPMPCHNQNFAQWFKDVPEVNKTVLTLMSLKLRVGTSQYYIDSKEMPEGSYFPLDGFEGNPDVSTWGKQSLAMWCPPIIGGEKVAGSFGKAPGPVSKMCKDLLLGGGPKNPAAVNGAVDLNPGLADLKHNYGFTIMGYTKFTYNPGDTFIFSGNEMWVFVDGRLTVDLGGTHQPAEARIAMIDLKNKFGWADRSRHDMHFFYANRQTDGVNFKFSTAMAEISIPKFGK